MKCQINVKLICHFVKPGKRTTDSGAEGKKERRWGTDRGHQRRAVRGGERVLCGQPGRQSMRIEASSLNASQFAIN